MSEYKRILWKNKGRLIPLAILLVVAAAASVASGYSLSWILNSYEAAEPLKALLWAILGSTAVYTMAILIAHCSGVFGFKMQHTIKNDLRHMVSRKIAEMPHYEFAEKDSGAYVSWLSNDVDQLYTNCFEAVAAGIGNAFCAVFALAVMAANSWYLGAVAITLFLIQFAVPQLLNKYMEQATKRRSAALELSMEAYKDTIMGAGIFYLSNLRERIIERILKSSDKAEREVFFSNRTTKRVKSVLSEVGLVNQLILMAVAMLAAILGDAPLGMAFAVGNLCGQFCNGIRECVQAVMSVRSSKPLWEKFAPLESSDEKKEKLSAVHSISMENLSFSYGDKAILEDKSFHFEQGGKYAIVGESGSGKSTVLKLLLGLLPNYEGSIFYNDTEQKCSNLSSLYEQVAYVEQQVYLFQDNLRFNITLGADYSDEEVMEAVRAANLESLVESLPNGLDSVIAENGKNLSGGQRQRIALARGLIRKVHYILMDEGTSALDEENAVDIEASLMEQNNLGVILITHNLHDCVKRQLNAVYQL
ncbi:MAG: ABC transporter ATP-binding protein [Oscillospiraceae bacterium]|nr:ABC transporter ATP-binding protein [Oscillospiraceae bacterium]